MTEELIACELSNFTPEVEIKLIGDTEVPFYATKGSAGVDLVSAVEMRLPACQTVKVRTGICISVPEGYEAQVRPRSGLAAKFNISVLNSPGTIDSDYRGEISVLLINHGDEDFLVTRGMRIAQLVLCPIAKFNFKVVDQLSQTERGVGGFGSTGVEDRPAFLRANRYVETGRWESKAPALANPPRKEPPYKTIMDRVNESCANPPKPEGLQYDEHKLARYDLIDPDFLHALAETLGMGAIKYAPDNWKKGLSFRKCFAAKMRHSWAWFRGETHCPEDGQHHLIGDTARSMFLYKLEKMGRIDCDDRPKE